MLDALFSETRRAVLALFLMHPGERFHLREVARRTEKARGIPARYTRVSNGLEEPEDLIADFKQAIEKSG